MTESLVRPDRPSPGYEGSKDFSSQAAGSIPLAFRPIAAHTGYWCCSFSPPGDLFFEKLVKTSPTLTDKKRGLRIAKEVERAVSHYLLTITLINVGVGCCRLLG